VNQTKRCLHVDWTPYLGHKLQDDWPTGVDMNNYKNLGKNASTLPEGFGVQRQVQKVLDDRVQMWSGEHGFKLGCGRSDGLCHAA
jgi:2-oxoglutarate dehydrogenase E1 component